MERMPLSRHSSRRQWRPTGDADVEVVVELGADVFDKVSGVVEALLLVLPVGSQWV